MDEQIRVNGGVYHWAIPMVMELCPGDSVAVDAGANAGYWALPLARHFNQVLAFEPDPEMRLRLGANLELNPTAMARLRVSPAALGDRREAATLHIRRALEGVRLNTGLSSLAAGDLWDHDSTVQVLTLDEEFRGFALDLGLVKVDVEGWESKVLAGAIETIKRDRPVIVWEAALSLDARLGGNNVQSTFQFLKDMNYEHLAIPQSPPLIELRTLVDLANIGGDVDVLSLPAERAGTRNAANVLTRYRG